MADKQPSKQKAKATKPKATKATKAAKAAEATKATKAAKATEVAKAKAAEKQHAEDLAKRNLEPELEAPQVEGLSQTEQEDYDAGQEAAKRGFPVRVCPHEDGHARDVWLRGYHDYAHPPSTRTVVPGVDGQDVSGPYRGKY